MCAPTLWLMLTICMFPVCRHGTEIALYKDVPQILHRLRAADVVLAAASRTSAPELCVLSPPFPS